jgi:hypothetical protein
VVIFIQNYVLFNLLIIFSVLAFITTPALATRPDENVNPNGSPSGEHYNSNFRHPILLKS